MSKRPTVNDLTSDDIKQFVSDMFECDNESFKDCHISQKALVQVIQENIGANGYELAKELESWHGAYNIDAHIVDILDSIDLEIDAIVQRKILRWVRVEKISPRFAITDLVNYERGSGKVESGEIVKINFELAKYHIKIEENLSALVPFEKVVGENDYE